MSKKYMIEIKPEYEDKIRSVTILGAENNNLYVDSMAVDELEELNSDYINEHFSDLQDTAYKKGFEDGKAANDKGCEGCKYVEMGSDTTICAQCCNAYHNQWTAKSPVDDGFVRGDVVVDENGIKGIVVSSDNDEDSYFYVLYNGCQVPQRVTQRYYKKTGEHYDIDKYLKEINRSKTDDIC